MVSSDEIRGQETQKLMAKNSNLSKDDAFMQSGKSANKMYKSQAE